MESSSSKRARAASGGNQVVCCLVDGCKSDLSKCRDYHRRHKVCELHSKTPKVTIAGREQRFCQQCSRFHSLGEFDEGKRSCRKRLEGHNRRRRKPQPESLPVKPGNFLSSGRGSRFMPFSSSPMIPASSVVSSTWGGGGVKMENSQTHIGSSYSDPYRGRQFPFLQGSPSSSNDFSSRALSLLSSSPAETPETGLTRMVIQGNPTHQGYNTCPQLQQGSQIFPPNLHHCQDIFQAASDGSCSATGPQQTVSFLWE